MAKTHANFLEQARATKDACKLMEDLWLGRLRKLINKHNGVGYGDAGDTPKPGYLNEDGSGNIDGLDFTRFDYMAAMAMFNQLESFFTGGSVSEATYRDTLSKITDATA